MQVNNRALRLGSNRRCEIMDEMENSAPMVIELLKSCLENTSGKLHIFKVYLYYKMLLRHRYAFLTNQSFDRITVDPTSCSRVT